MTHSSVSRFLFSKSISLLCLLATLPPYLEAQEVPSSEKLVAMQLEMSRLSEGWIRLFDGHTLTGWQPAGKADWRVENGTITVNEGEVGLLLTTSTWKNYELQFEFQSDTETNSGVFLRTAPKPTNPAVDCYEWNIAPTSNPFPTGSLVGRQRVAKGSELVSEPGRWYQAKLRAVEGDVTVWIDGQEILRYTDSKPLAAGHIGLQHNQGRAAFRNIEIRPLGLNSLIPLQNLVNWITDQAGPGKFTLLADGSLRIEGGKGQIESKEKYGDFVLQLEGKLDHDHSNSGLFFRCIPGEALNGYECQLHQGFLENDRSKPADGGLGGVFRRQNARVVLGEPLQTFSVTIVAQGPHIATWVNGVPMVDFTDTRPADPNPRKGLRLTPGSLMFQGHDPETRITISKLQILSL
jgi:hypothetical protein